MYKILLLVLMFGFNVSALGFVPPSVDESKPKCDKGNSTSCYWLGFAHEHGVGVEPNPHKAFKYYQQSCELGFADGCYMLGFFEE